MKGNEPDFKLVSRLIACFFELADVGAEVAVKALVEDPVAFVDEGDPLVRVEGAAATERRPLLLLLLEVLQQQLDPLLVVLRRAVRLGLFLPLLVELLVERNLFAAAVVGFEVAVRVEDC